VKLFYVANNLNGKRHNDTSLFLSICSTYKEEPGTLLLPKSEKFLI
jgi:hypothetical protein